MPRLAISTILAPKLGEFARAYPGIVLDVTTHDSRMDIVAGGFDAGIHFGEYIEKDMIAVRMLSGALVRVLDDWCQPFPGFFSTIPAGVSSPQLFPR